MFAFCDSCSLCLYFFLCIVLFFVVSGWVCILEERRRKKGGGGGVICVPGCGCVILYVSDAHYLLRMCKMK